MKTSIAFLFVLCALFAPAALAFDVNLVKGIHTSHIQKGEWHEDNQLYGVSVGNFHYAGFINSYKTRTHAFGLNHTWDRYYFNVTMRYGIMQGYTKYQMPTCFGEKTCIYISPSLGIKLNPVIDEVFNTRFMHSRYTVVNETMIHGTAVINAIGITYQF